MARRTKRAYDQTEEESIYGSDSIYAAPRDEDDYDEVIGDESEENQDEEQEKKDRIFGKFFSKKDSNIQEDGEDPQDTEDMEADTPSISMSESYEEEDDEEEDYDYDDEGGGFPIKIVSIVAAVVILLAAGAYFTITKLGSAVSGEAYVQSVAAITGRGSSNGMTNRYTGEVEPQSSWKITLNNDSTVAKCYVQVGSEVKKGDKLFKYDTESLQLTYEKAQLDIDTLENENKELAKNIETYEKEYKTADAAGKIQYQTQILTAQAQIKKNEFSLKSAKEQLKKIKKTIKEATVKSKMDGVVKSINTKLGEGNVDSASDSGMSSEDSNDSSYMTILATGDFRIKGVINETNIYAISEGDPVIVRSRVNTEDKWTGVISKIKTDSTVDDSNQNNDDFYGYDNNGESTSQYNFFVTLSDDEGLLMGQHVFIELDQGQDDGTEGLWLPSSFITIEGDHYYVWKDNKGKLKKVEIQVDPESYNEMSEAYQVTSGVSLEDYIAVASENNQENEKTTKTLPNTEEEVEEGQGVQGPEGEEGDMVYDEDVMEGEDIDSDQIESDGISGEDY